MGGGKPKKPLSALDKSRKETRRRKVAKEERKYTYHTIDENLLRRASRTVEGLDVVTPSTLASTLGIKVSLAKAIVRRLVEQGKLKLVDKWGDLLIAQPVKKPG